MPDRQSEEGLVVSHLAARRLEGRVAVVTGAGRNIGLAIAARLTVEGARVLLVGRNRAQLTTAADRLRAEGGQVELAVADVTDLDDAESVVEAAVDRWGRLDILVNNAGIYGETSFLDVEPSAYRAIFDTNVLGTILMSQATARHMARTRERGAIVHLSSIDARASDGTTTLYSASKAAVASLGRTMAVDLAPAGVRVNTVSPGWVHTHLVDDMPDEGRRHLLDDFGRVPLRRVVEPDEVAAAVAFLVSDDASGVTGTDLIVDGGLTATHYVVETL